MILSLIPPDQHYAWADRIAKAHAEFTEKKLMEALVARFGEIPSIEEIAEHCKCGIDENLVHHYIWVEEVPEIGHLFDMSEVLCSIAPPRIYHPEKPKL
jgi:hypothetical protein